MRYVCYSARQSIIYQINENKIYIFNLNTYVYIFEKKSDYNNNNTIFLDGSMSLAKAVKPELLTRDLFEIKSFILWNGVVGEG